MEEGVMRTTLAVFLLGCNVALPAHAQLAGRVLSAEGPMEGVVVSARKAGSPGTVSGVRGSEGRASGYELENSVTADIANGATAPIELRLRKAQDLSAQLTNAEWLQSFPGTS